MDRRTFLKITTTTLCSLLLGGRVPAQEITDNHMQKTPKKKKSIYVTIDDGPRKNMGPILDELQQGQRVTFFLIGRQLNSPEHEELARRAIQEGHSLGNHSYTHPFFSRISTKRAKEEIYRTHEILEKIYESEGVEMPLLFRFPYGDSGREVRRGRILGSREHQRNIKNILSELGYHTYFWTLDTLDWEHYSSKFRRSIENILLKAEQAKEGDIVLMHDLPVTAKNIIPYYTRFPHRYQLNPLLG